MQSMAVAVARNLAGIPDAALEESEPAAPILLFRRLHDAEGRPYHRLGAEAVRIQPGTKASAWFGNGTEERFNQRYTLAKDYVAQLERAGVQVSAVSVKDRLSDAVEAPAHPFFVGFQSHPELISRPAAPHPAMDAFLRAAQARRDGHP
jgi:CTP synthase